MTYLCWIDHDCFHDYENAVFLASASYTALHMLAVLVMSLILFFYDPYLLCCAHDSTCRFPCHFVQRLRILFFIVVWCVHARVLMGTDHVADVVFMYCFSPCYYCCCVVVIFALLLFSLMGLRAVSPLAAVYSSVSHRVFFKLCHVFCVFCVVDWCYCWCLYVWSCSYMSFGCKECAMFCCLHYWACVAGVSLGVGHRCWGM